MIGLLLRALVALLRALGPVRASNLGGALARAIGPRLPVSRVADRNLRAALPELDAASRARIVREVWDNLGRTVAELPHLGRLPQNPEQGPGWEVSDPARARALAAAGGPTLFPTAHLGNWEMAVVAAAAYGIPLSIMYRAAANSEVDALVQRLRRDNAGATVPMFAKGARGARQAMGHLSRGGFLGMLVDQKLNEGIEARLFGLPAMTTTAPAVFALRHRCPVVPIHVERLGPARMRVVIGNAIPLPETGDRAADTAALTQAINDVLEAWIRARPGAWLWLHRRWPNAAIRDRLGEDRLGED